MKPEVVVVATAYVPGVMRDIYTNNLEKVLRKENRRHDWEVICVPFDPIHGDVDEHVKRLYDRTSILLRKLDSDAGRTRHNLLSGVNLVLLYLAAGERRSSSVFRKFGTEAFVTPIRLPEDACYRKPNHRSRVANSLVKESIRALRHARKLFGVIAEHVRNSDSRTPMLLPEKNFGSGIDNLFRGIRAAALDRSEDEKRFRDRIKHIERSLPMARQDDRKYFQGRSKIIFRGQRKGGPRHGLAPEWRDSDHEFSCIIRGRLRFGVPYDPKFHYDCDIPRSVNREFPSCHGTERIRPGRQSVNIAPNDNIR